MYTVYIIYDYVYIYSICGLPRHPGHPAASCRDHRPTSRGNFSRLIFTDSGAVHGLLQTGPSFELAFN